MATARKLLVAAAVSMAGWAAVPAAALAVPVNNFPPSISGDPYLGLTLSCSNGSWNDPFLSGPTYTYVYQWRYKTENMPTPTSTNSFQYQVQPGDVGRRLVCRVTATDPRDSSTAFADSFPVTAQTLPATVRVRLYSGSISGNVGTATAGVNTTVKLERNIFGTGGGRRLVGSATAVSNTSGEWSLNLPERAVSEQDALVVSYSGTGAPADAEYYPNSTLQFIAVAGDGSVITDSCFDCTAVSATINGGPPIDATRSQTFAWEISPPSPISLVDSVQVTERRLITSGALSTKSNLVATSDAPLPGPRSFAVLGALPGCVADLVTLVVRCSGLVAGGDFSVARGSSTPVSLTKSSDGLSGYAVLPGLQSGDRVMLTVGARTLTTLRVGRLIAHVDPEGKIEGTCEPYQRFVFVSFVVWFPASGVCPAAGTMTASDSGFAVADEFSSGATEVRVPRVDITTPTDGESLFGGTFTAYGDVHYFAEELGKWVHTPDPATLKIRPRGADPSANVEYGNANTAEGTHVAGLAPGRYTATWTVADRHGDTHATSTDFVVQSTPTGAGPPGPTGPAGPQGPQGPAGPPGVAKDEPKREATVRCRLRGKRVKCRVRLSVAGRVNVSVQLVRRGRVYAVGHRSLRSRVGEVNLRTRRKLQNGHYRVVVVIDGPEGSTTTIRRVVVQM